MPVTYDKERAIPSCEKKQFVAQAPLDLQLAPRHSVLIAKQVNTIKIQIKDSPLRKTL